MPASASDVLGTIVVRTFAVLRALSVLVLFCYLAVWWSWYAEHPAGMAAVAATAAWGVTFVAVSLRRGIGTALAAGNVVVAVVLGAGAALFVPAETLGAAWMWLFPTAMHACVVAAWVFPLPVFAAALAAAVGAMAVGAAAAPSRLGIAVALLVLLASASRVVIGRLRRLAAHSDDRLDVAAARRRAEAVAAARERDRRERERVLHDTVLNTLTGIGWGGGVDVALTRSECGDSVAAVRALLDGRRGERAVTVEERLAEVAEAARARGLEVTGTFEAGAGAGAGDSAPATVPPDVVAAFGAAVAELLANVERHAGTGRARLEVHRDQAATAQAATAQAATAQAATAQAATAQAATAQAVTAATAQAVTVAVHDDGAGFHPARVGADRLGLRHSVHGRMADVGARVALRSAPGRGTSVMLTWHAPPKAPSGSGTVSAGTVAAGTVAAGTVSAGAVAAAELRRAYEDVVRRATAVVAVAWQTITLAPLLVSLSRARSPLLALLLWLAASAGVVLAARMLRRRPLARLECVALIVLGWAVTLGVAANTLNPVTGGGPGNLGWTALTLPLLVMLVAVSRPLREWLPTLAATTAVLAVATLAGAGTEPLAVSALIGVIYSQCALLVFVTMIGPVLRRAAERTAQAMAAEAELAARHETEVLVRQDRARGLRAVERDVLPLLAAIGDGLLDPRDPAVRDRCSRHAAAVRRSLAAGQSAALGDLAPALVDAEERGVHLDVQVCGDLRRAPARVRAELASHMAGALAAVPSEGATLTLFCDAAGGSLFLTYPSTYSGDAEHHMATHDAGAGGTDNGADGNAVGGAQAAHPPRPLVAVSTDRDDGRVCLELRWHGALHPV